MRSCKCVRDNWILDGLDESLYGNLTGYVRCRLCGAAWKTDAKYIQNIEGSRLYREQFLKEHERKKQILHDKMLEVQNEIRVLRDKYNRLERMYNKSFGTGKSLIAPSLGKE